MRFFSSNVIPISYNLRFQQELTVVVIILVFVADLTVFIATNVYLVDYKTDPQIT
jgi:hypothetical protein